MTAVLFFGGLALLYFGGESLVRGAAAIGVRMRLSPLVVGLTLIAFATSAPELAISLDAAFKGLSGFAVGNVVGSNICNLALIFGLVTIVKPARVGHALVRRDVLVLSITTLLVPGLLLDGTLERAEGTLLVLSMAAYLFLTVWHARARPSSADDNAVPLISEALTINLILCVAGIAMLVFGSRMFVDASVAIAQAVGVPPAIVGLSAAAFGSSLPELTAAVISAKHGHPEMAAGNLIGSNIFNLLLILGVTATVRPLSSESVTRADLALMIFVTVVVLAVMLLRERVARRDGILLVSAYVLYVAWLYMR